MHTPLIPLALTVFWIIAVIWAPYLLGELLGRLNRRED